MYDWKEIYEDFIKENKNYGSMLKTIMQIDEDFIVKCNDFEYLENLIMRLKPATKNRMFLCKTVIKKFAEYIRETNKDFDISEILDNIDKVDNSKDYGYKKSYITHDEYNDLIEEIYNVDPYNGEHYSGLVSAIYDGIYCGDFSVIINLRGGDLDITNDTAILNTNFGKNYKLKIEHETAIILKELSYSNTGYANRAKGSVVEYEKTGLYPDSVFKTRAIETKGGITTDVMENYHNILVHHVKKITKQCGYNIKPIDIFISGILYRVSQELKQDDIKVDSVNYNPTFERYLEKELFRVNYQITTSVFKNRLKAYIENFL